MRQRQRSTFTTLVNEGALLPVDVLQRIAQLDTTLGGITSEDYHLNEVKINEEINNAWLRVLRSWKTFQTMRARLPHGDTGTTLTRERWLLPLFAELGYGRLVSTKPLEIEQKSYPISHGWQHLPIHLVSYQQELDTLTRNAATGYRYSPYSLVQELLNRSSEYLWGIVSNGYRLRVLRKNASLTRQAYIEFDLEAMMQGENYADFVLFWLLCHESRVEAERASDCWLEKWSREAQKQGMRVLDRLRDGVEEAINSIGSGFLAHPANHDLRRKLREGELQAQDYYRQVLRFVYRLIVLFVAEDRRVLFHPQASEEARARYNAYYSTTRLRYLAERRLGTRHSDLYAALWLVMEQVGGDTGCDALGLPALNGFLFSHKAIPDLVGCQLANYELLNAVRSLAITYDGQVARSVDYKNIGAEELGSIYESLLELHPELSVEAATFALKTAGGNERKTSGSYYTPSSLINCLLDSALEPVLAEAYAQPDPEQAILNLKVCDPACGSGHFLIAAAHRIAKRLAAVRTGTEEPGAEARRTALRDVVGHCIYGVDINPMAVELCKVNLWMEAIVPGKPFTFLDAHIQSGNSLLGATPALLRQGIPDSAFEPIEGDDRKICNELKKRNKQYRAGQLSLPMPDAQPWDRLGDFSTARFQMEEMDDNTVEAVHRKQAYFAELVTSSDYLFGKLWADAWCAAFVWKKTREFAYSITEEVFRKIEQSPYHLASWMREEIERLAKQYQFFHWHLAFPDVFRVPAKDEAAENEQTGWCGGFDVVLANPPWERIKIQEKEWFAQRQPAIADASNAAARRKMIAALAQEDPELYKAFMEDQRKATGESHLVRDSGRYPLCGRGDVNTYSIFAENMRNTISAMGRVGCIVPSGIATDDTNKYFFQNVVTSRALVSLYDFENAEGIFDGVHRSYKFCLLTLVGPARAVASHSEFAFFAHSTEELVDEEKRFALSPADIALINPNTKTCPIFRTRRDAALTKAIYERVPVLIKEGPPEVNPWGISFKSMFHMANDSHLFMIYDQLLRDGWKLEGNRFCKGGEACLPLYEGKMVSLFDHRFSSYELPISQATQGQEEVPQKDPFYVAMPRYWIHESHMEDAIYQRRRSLLVFRDIARSTDIRTAIFSIIPVVACNNKLPIILLAPDRTYDVANLVTCFSSFILDYATRQKVGGTSLSFFILKQLPILPPEQYRRDCEWDCALTLADWIMPRALELSYTAWDLEAFAWDCGYDGPPFCWDEERRFMLRCELDAAYFHLYGIARDDVDYIMETFPIAKSKDEKQYGEYRTKRVILEIYDEMQRAMESGVSYRARLDPPPADPGVAHPPRV
jgi:hypothetical protein